MTGPFGYEPINNNERTWASLEQAEALQDELNRIARFGEQTPYTVTASERTDSVASDKVWEDYPFEVVDAEEKVSSSGNPMIALKLRVFALKANVLIDDWLVVSGGRMEFKLKRFCQATGQEEKYTAGALEVSDCLGATGRLRLGHEERDGFFNNRVKEYLKRAEKAAEKPQPATAAAGDIPF